MAIKVTIKIDSEQLERAIRRLKESGVMARAMAAAMRQVGKSLQRAILQSERQCLEIRRQEWWKRDEEPPDYQCDRNSPEWWERGEEPPSFGCAA